MNLIAVKYVKNRNGRNFLVKYIKSAKRQIILAALVLALGSAVYLNWRFMSPKEILEETSSSSTKELGQAQFVSNTINNSDDNMKNSDVEKPEKEMANKENDSLGDTFHKIREERQKARDEATDTLKDIIENVQSSQEIKSEAVKKASEMAQRIEEEANIEALVKAKGFERCLVFIQNDECSVVVSGQPLTEILATQIKDIACGQGKIAVDKIKIIESK